MLKYPRIAVTALSLTACLLLLALWWRSYGKIDVFQYRTSSQYVLAIGSHSGSCYVSWFLSNVRPKTWQFFSYQVKGPPNTDSFVAFALKPLVIVQRWGLSNITILAPHWFVASLFMVLAAAAATWFRWSRRFSLRTLLIATTLVAIALGLIAAIQ